MYKKTAGAKGDKPLHDLSRSWSQVAAFVSAVDAGLNKWLTTTYGIGLTEYRALVLLSRTPDKELRVNDLAQQVGLNQSSVTRLLSRLEDKGLTYRDTCPDDGRGIYAVIAERGEALLSEAGEPHQAKIQELLEGAAKRDPQLDQQELGRAFGAIGGLIK
ncbi:MarR family winged helix-turn-helix transcriptional regulator [Amycolatopsis taiwanensis]|uniref:MarR family transcriptional regulator n=1 Tax=Amycolatopsis taiwanensis TaxID=342230 RepID=A0A9W6QVQ6_9PSEU|nr:MarR family transcriptional regulator [Amycolatopsis taiwanensis]GLY64916.1 MarR family transcriptional regulator [Amycolatopsis taiwanensis]